MRKQRVRLTFEPTAFVWELAEKLEKHYKDGCPDFGGRSLRALSIYLGVSRSTLSKAAAILKHQGKIAYATGKAPRLPSEVPASARQTLRKPPVRSADKIAALIADRIRDGVYRSNRPLPKRRAFMREFSASDHTVSGALVELTKKKLIYKKGRSWVVGSEPSGISSVSTPMYQPVILLLQSREQSWRGLYQAERTGRFCRSFEEAARHYGVQLLPVYSTPKAVPHDSFAGGSERVSRFALSLGDRYTGTLIVDDVDELENLEQWIFDLSLLKRPVVWLDRYGKNFRTRPKSRLFTRCYFSEENAIDLALSTLFRLGHRNVGFPVLWDKSWRPDRGKLLRSRAGKKFREMTITNNPPVADLIQLPDAVVTGILLELLRSPQPYVKNVLQFQMSVLPRAEMQSRFRNTGELSADELGRLVGYFGDNSKRVASYHRYLLRLLPLMNRYMQNAAITALIAPCDQDAIHLYYWLQAAGVNIPNQLSLLSFDNYSSLIPLPVTTIDFGFGNLGYAAFHTLWGKLPMRKDSNGDIATTPEIIHRGSLRQLCAIS